MSHFEFEKQILSPIPLFDTLLFAESLIDAGFPPSQAKCLVQKLTDIFSKIINEQLVRKWELEMCYVKKRTLWKYLVGSTICIGGAMALGANLVAIINFIQDIL